MVFGIDDALAAAGISALGSIGGGFLSGQSQRPKETKIERTKRKMVDRLIASLEGNGPYSDLFNADEDVFQKSFVEPAQSLFRNQIAPQIQQESIAGGQQRGTGLDDQLLRAGVDLDSIINQHMAEYQQGALNRKQNTINSILGVPSGAPVGSTGTENLMGAAGGYLSSPAFSDVVSGYFKNKPNTTAPSQPYARKGFEDWQSQPLGSPYWRQ